MFENRNDKTDTETERRNQSSPVRDAVAMRDEVVRYLTSGDVSARLQGILGTLIREQLRQAVAQGLRDEGLQQEIQTGIAQKTLRFLGEQLDATSPQVLRTASAQLAQGWKQAAANALNQGFQEAMNQQSESWRPSIDQAIRQEFRQALEEESAQWRQRANELLRQAIDDTLHSWREDASKALQRAIGQELAQQLSHAEIERLVKQAIAHRTAAQGAASAIGDGADTPENVGYPGSRPISPRPRKPPAAPPTLPWYKKVLPSRFLEPLLWSLVAVLVLALAWALATDRLFPTTAKGAGPTPTPTAPGSGGTPPTDATSPTTPAPTPTSAVGAGSDSASLKKTWEGIVTGSNLASQREEYLRDYDCWFPPSTRKDLDSLVGVRDHGFPAQRFVAAERTSLSNPCIASYHLHGADSNRAVSAAQAAAHRLLAHNRPPYPAPTSFAIDGRTGPHTYQLLNAALAAADYRNVAIDGYSPVEDYLFALYVILIKLHKLDGSGN